MSWFEIATVFSEEFNAFKHAAALDSSQASSFRSCRLLIAIVVEVIDLEFRKDISTS